jgi:hypothetical protein
MNYDLDWKISLRFTNHFKNFKSLVSKLQFFNDRTLNVKSGSKYNVADFALKVSTEAIVYSSGLSNAPRVSFTLATLHIKNIQRLKRGDSQCKMAGLDFTSLLNPAL